MESAVCSLSSTTAKSSTIAFHIITTVRGVQQRQTTIETVNGETVKSSVRGLHIHYRCIGKIFQYINTFST